MYAYLFSNTNLGSRVSKHTLLIDLQDRVTIVNSYENECITIGEVYKYLFYRVLLN